MPQKELLKESLLYTAGNILQKLGDFVFIPIFTYYLTLEEYGDLSLYLSIIPLLLLLFQQGTRTGFLRLYYEYEGKKRESLYTTALLYNIAASVILIFILYIFRNTFTSLISSRLAFFPAGILILAIAFTNNLFQLNLVYFQVKHKAGFYVAYSLLCFLFRYGLIIALIVQKGMGLNGYLLGYLGANTVLVFLPNLVYLIQSKFNFSIVFLRPLLTFSLPVMPHLISMWTYNLSSRVIVERYVSTEDYAVFSLGANLAAVFSVLASSFALAWGPHYLKIATQQVHHAAEILKKDITLGLKLFSLVFICFLLFSKELVTVAGRNIVYHSAYKIIPFILLGYFFLLMYVLFANSFYLRKKTLLLSLISVSTGAFGILNLVYCSKRYGIIGASVAMAVNYFVLFVTIAAFSQRIFRIPVIKEFAVTAGIAVALMFFIRFLNEIVEIGLLSFAVKCGGFSLLVYVLNRKEVQWMVSASKAAVEW